MLDAPPLLVVELAANSDFIARRREPYGGRRAAIDVDHDRPIVGVLSRESIRPADAV